jgi:hypothetical protein
MGIPITPRVRRLKLNNPNRSESFGAALSNRLRESSKLEPFLPLSHRGRFPRCSLSGRDTNENPITVISLSMRGAVILAQTCCVWILNHARSLAGNDTPSEICVSSTEG